MVIRRLPYLRWRRLPRWRSFILPRHRARIVREQIKKVEKHPRIKVVELVPQQFQPDTEIVFKLPKYGRLAGIDLVLDIKITGGTAPSQGVDWHLRGIHEVEIQDAGRTFGRFNTRIMRYITAQLYDYDIKNITAGAGETVEEKDLIRFEFDWTIREDTYIEQFINEGKFGIDLFNKSDPALILRTKTLDVTDTTIDRFMIRPVLYIAMHKTPLKPELWADYKVLSFSAKTTYELELQDNVYHLLNAIMEEDTSFNLSFPDKIEMVDTERDFTFFSISNNVSSELIRIWNEQDKSFPVFVINIGYFRNVLIQKKREVLFKVSTFNTAGNIYLQQIGYKK